MTTAELERTSELRTSDRCDMRDCNAQARVRAHFEVGCIDFCFHCAQPIEIALSEQALRVTDERDRLLRH